MRLCTNTLLASVLLLASVAPVHGGLITFNFTGSIDQKFGSVLGITSPVGTQVSGSFSYDTSTPGSFLTFTNELIGTYQQSLPAGLRIKVGSVSVSSSNYLVEISSATNITGTDELTLLSRDIPSVQGGIPDPQTVLRLDFLDFGPKVFQDASLPHSLDLKSFTQAYGTIQGGLPIKKGGGYGYGYGYRPPPPYGSLSFSFNTLSAATTTTTPEPATLILLGIGLTWLLSITVLGALQVRLKRRAASAL